MKKIWIFIGIIVAFALIIMLVATQTKKEAEEIKIGVILPLSGDASVWGITMKEGIDLALDEINSTGGIRERKLKLLYEDDKANPGDGVAAANKLITIDKVKAILGVANSSVALAIIPIINEHKIVFISGGASSPKLTGSSLYFFRTWPSDIEEAIAMANFAVKQQNYKKLAILYINNEYGLGLKDPFSRLVSDMGAKIVSVESFDQGATDFRSQLSKIKTFNPEAVYLVGNPREMARCLVQAKEMRVKAQFLSTSALIDPGVIKTAGNAAEGVLLSDASVDFSSADSDIKEFVTKFKAKYNKEPGMLSVTGYDSLKILSEAMKNSGISSEAIKTYIQNLKNFQTVSGKIEFIDGDIKRPVRISIIRNGRFENFALVKQ